MTTPPDPARHPPAPLTGRLLRITLLIVLVFILFFGLIPAGEEQVFLLAITHGLFGWIGFLGHVLPAVSWNPMAVMTALACIVALLVGAHLFLRWMSRSWQSGTSAVWHWRLRWTASGLVLVMLAFTAGIAVVGTTHQVAWLSRSTEPWVTYERWSHPRNSAYMLLRVMEEARQAKRAVDPQEIQRMRESVGEHMRVIIVNDAAGLPRVGLVGSRDPGDRRFPRGAFATLVDLPDGIDHQVGEFLIEQWAEMVSKAESGQSLGGH